MPEHGRHGRGISDADLAAVLTYIRNSWGNNADEVSADDIEDRPRRRSRQSVPMMARCS